MQMQRGILGSDRRGQGRKSILGGVDPIRQFSQPMGDPMGGMDPAMAMSGGMGAPQPAGPPGYGSDEWAMQGGPGAMIWRELAQAGVYNAIDPKNAGEVFSPASRAILGGDYAKKMKRKA